jgi:hypothetical protein
MINEKYRIMDSNGSERVKQCEIRMHLMKGFTYSLPRVDAV